MELARPEELGFSPSRLARILPAMQGYVDRRQVAGVVTLIARRGRVVHFETCGMMGVETTRPMRRDAIFRIYSMTKPITSAAAMMLFEEGKFRLGDPISRYLPMFKDMKVLVNKPNGDTELVPARREITVRDLFTHTAGLSYGFDPNTHIDELYRQKLWGTLEKDSNTTLEQVMEEVAKLPLVLHPGTAFHYSVSIDVLGYLVQVVSGKSFENFLKERIFDPLGMSDTAFWVPPEKMSRFTTTCGPTDDGGLKAIDSPTTSNYAKPAKFLSGGGGLVSTTEDYLRFCQMLLNQGRLGNARLLGRKTVEMMFANHLTPDVPFNDPGYSFGLGGSVVVDPPSTQRLGTVGSWSWGGAANTKFWIDPREELIGILMLQYMPSFVLPIDIDFNNLVYQALVD
jgi:CubicO group peptidase (beta-lactamase class C family)